MGSDLHIYGGFNINPYLALRVFEVVEQIVAQNTDLSLSHVDDDTCEICRGASARSAPPEVPAPEPAEIPPPEDASPPGGALEAAA